MSNELEAKALAVVEQAHALAVVDAESCQRAADILTGIKAIRAEIDATFDPVIAAAHKAHKEAVAAKKKHEAPLLTAETVIKSRIGQYADEEERKRRAEEARLAAIARAEAEKRALEEAAALEAQGDREAARAVVAEAVAAPAPVVVIEKPKVQGVSTRGAWTFRVVDAAKIPREYLIPDEKKIRGVVRALGAECRIPGVQVYQETVVSVRRARAEEEPAF